MGAVLGKMGLASITNGWSETKSRELITAIICSNTFVGVGAIALSWEAFGKENVNQATWAKASVFLGAILRF